MKKTDSTTKAYLQMLLPLGEHNPNFSGQNALFCPRSQSLLLCPDQNNLFPSILRTPQSVTDHRMLWQWQVYRLFIPHLCWIWQAQSSVLVKISLWCKLRLISEEINPHKHHKYLYDSLHICADTSTKSPCVALSSCQSANKFRKYLSCIRQLKLFKELWWGEIYF